MNSRLSTMKKFFRIFLCGTTLVITNNSDAQQYRWAINGGSADMGLMSLTERVQNMATDDRGNLYVTSSVYRNYIKVAGVALSDGHDAAFTDILLTSLDCSGKHRWSKVIGGIPGDEAPFVKVSRQGQVYLAGYVTKNNAQPVDFDSDTTLPAAGFQSAFIVQYDTLGHQKWLRMLQADTVTAWSMTRTKIIDVDLDSAGNIYALCMLPPNSALAGSTLTTPVTGPEVGLYVLKYTTAGVLSSITQMDMKMPFSSATIINGMYMRRHPQTGNYYINGNLTPYVPYNDTLFLGSTYMDTRLYLACFSPAGSLLWHKKSTYAGGLNNSMWQDGVDFDASGNIYIGGQGGHGDSFNGASFTNPINPTISGVASFVMKMSTAGVMSWVSAGYSQYQQTWQMAMSSNKIAVGGVYADLMVWGSDSMSNNSVSSGQDGWFAILDKATGKIEYLDSLAGPSIYEGVTALHYRNNDLFIGGYFQSKLNAGTYTLNSGGGSSDFFVVKYGDTCGAPPVVPTQTSNSELSVIKVYPTIVPEQFYVDNSEDNMPLQCYNMTGQLLLQQLLRSGRNRVVADQLPPGMYIVKLKRKDGSVINERIIKL